MLLRRYTLILGFVIGLVLPVNAQHAEMKYNSKSNEIPSWVKLMYEEDADPGEVAKAYKAYYQEREFVKNGHTQYYKRWLRSMLRDINGANSGKRTSKEIRLEEQAYISKSKELKAKRQNTGSWECLGPIDFDKEAEGRSYASGAAHVYTVEQSVSNPDILYAGTATTGLWKSIDHGENWILCTRDLLVNGIRSIEIDHKDPEVVYFNAAGGGVYKSIDGGQTWTLLMDAVISEETHNANDIVMHPTDNNILFLSSQRGFFKTENAGQTWEKILNGNFQELEFQPSNADVLFLIKQVDNRTEFYKSIDGGETFELKDSGWPGSDLEAGEEQKRTEIAVTEANPNKVYALATGNANGGSGLYGIYVSEDAGESWTFKCCGPQPSGPAVAGQNINMMGWADDGSDDGGQYYYDLALDVSPTNENKVFVAGVNLWISEDGGDTFVCPSKWSHSGKVNYVHADIHDVRYVGDELWVACDGGIFFSDDDAAVFQRKMKGIAGTDFWGFDSGFLDGEIMLGGTYHNGTLLKDHDVYENGWISTRGGDNIRGYVNFGNPRIVYDDGGKRALPGDRTKPFIEYSFGRKPNASYVTGESSDLAYDARCYNIVYSGFETGVWKSEDDGGSWDMIYDFGENVAALEISRTDPMVLYAATFVDWWGEKRIYRTTDAGATWTNITPLSLFEGGYWPPIDVAIDSKDPMKIWIARTPQSGGYNPLNGSKVFQSSDGGDSWTNITTPSLDDEHLTNIEHQRGTEGGVYLGTRRAVYYKNDNMNDWELYNSELPLSTYSTKLVPYYWEGKIRNGTNRSVHQCDFYEVSKPEAQIAADRLTSHCTRDSIQFIDHSALFNEGATWTWSFPGGIPETSNERHPKVVYPNLGNFDVSLTVTDVNGSDSQTIENFIQITSDCDPEGVPGNAIQLDENGDYAYSENVNLGLTNTMTMSAWIKPSGIQNEYTGIVMASDGNAFGFNFRPNMELGYHWPNGQWYWSSGLYIPADEWSHVAIVTEPTGITLYLNGVGVKHVFEPAQVETDGAAFHIGSYLAWDSRNFKGMMDEVCIWDKALTEQEIRLGMHLTKDNNDPKLKAYYQFNATTGPESDRIGSAHATLRGGTARLYSSAPVGAGESQAKLVVENGTSKFLDRKFSIEFENDNPQGEVVVSHIEVDPDLYPSDNADSGYWVLHNFGEQDVTEIKSLLIHVPNILEDDLQFKHGHLLYHRAFNDENNTWSYMSSADQIFAGQRGLALYNDLTLPFGQLSITREKIIRQEEEELTSTKEFLPKQVLVYPNPLNSENKLRVKTDALGAFEFSLYDTQGKCIKSVELVDEGEVDVSEFQAGTYFFQLISKTKIQNGVVTLF